MRPKLMGPKKMKENSYINYLILSYAEYLEYSVSNNLFSSHNDNI